MTPGTDANEASIVLADGPLVAPVLSRVVGMLAARADCPIDRLDDALLLADAVAAASGAVAINGRIGIRVSAADGNLHMHVGPLRQHGAQDLLASAELPGVGNVLQRVADEVTSVNGGDGAEHVHIRLGFAR